MQNKCKCGHEEKEHVNDWFYQGCSSVCGCRKFEPMEEDIVQILRGALADMAMSEDLTLEQIKHKAKRIYDETT